jgi:hypothetical protein
VGALTARLGDRARRHHLACRLVAGCIVLASAGTAVAQDVTAAALKAAFVYQMPKFIEWPAGAIAAAGPFSVCVLGDPPTTEAFERVMKGLKYEGRPINVSRVSSAALVQGCHALYVAPGTPQVSSILADLREHPVLTVSDVEGFTKLGGVAQLYYESGKLRMFINLPAAQRAKLRFSSHLLRLSKEP